MIIFLTNAWKNIVKYWKLIIGSIFAITIYILGFKKGNAGFKKEEQKRKLSEEDLKIYKKNTQEKELIDKQASILIKEKEEELAVEKSKELQKAKKRY